MCLRTVGVLGGANGFRIDKYNMVFWIENEYYKQLFLSFVLVFLQNLSRYLKTFVDLSILYTEKDLTSKIDKQ